MMGAPSTCRWVDEIPFENSRLAGFHTHTPRLISSTRLHGLCMYPALPQVTLRFVSSMFATDYVRLSRPVYVQPSQTSGTSRVKTRRWQL